MEYSPYVLICSCTPEEKYVKKTDSILTWKKKSPHLSPIIVAEKVKEINHLARYGGPQCGQILSEFAFEYLFEAYKKLSILYLLKAAKSQKVGPFFKNKITKLLF